MEKVKGKHVIDIFCGNNHSFYINSKNEVWAWGLNNHGQLGIGHKQNTAIPTQIKSLKDKNVV